MIPSAWRPRAADETAGCELLSTCGQVRNTSTIRPIPRVGVILGSKVGIVSRITAHQSSGTGGSCQGAGSTGCLLSTHAMRRKRQHWHGYGLGCECSRVLHRRAPVLRRSGQRQDVPVHQPKMTGAARHDEEMKDLVKPENLWKRIGAL